MSMPPIKIFSIGCVMVAVSSDLAVMSLSDIDYARSALVSTLSALAAAACLAAMVGPARRNAGRTIVLALAAYLSAGPFLARFSEPSESLWPDLTPYLVAPLAAFLVAAAVLSPRRRPSPSAPSGS